MPPAGTLCLTFDNMGRAREIGDIEILSASTLAERVLAQRPARVLAQQH